MSDELSSGWCQVSWADLPDTSPEHEPMDWRFLRGAVGSTQVGVSRFAFEPGARMPFGHRHLEQEEVYVVVAGAGRLKLDGDWTEVAAGDVVRVAPEVGRGFAAGPDGLEVICVGGRRPPGNDGRPVPGFWE